MDSNELAAEICRTYHALTREKDHCKAIALTKHLNALCTEYHLLTFDGHSFLKYLPARSVTLENENGEQTHRCKK